MRVCVRVCVRACVRVCLPALVSASVTPRDVTGGWMPICVRVFVHYPNAFVYIQLMDPQPGAALLL